MNYDSYYSKMPEILKYPIYPTDWNLGDHINYLKAFYKTKKSNNNDAEKILTEKYAASKVVLMDSGRSALVLALQCLGINCEKHEVILTTFNCPAVIDAVLSVGAKPVLADINRNFELD